MSPTVKGIQCIGPEQNYSEIPLQNTYSIDVSFSDTLRRQFCRSVMRLCNFLTHTTNGRTGEKGVDCHRKLRGRDDITLDLTGKALQRGYKGDLPLPASEPGKKKAKSKAS